MNAVTARLDRLSGPLLAALGFANALFFWTFIAVLFVAMQALPASARECGGDNVIAAMKRDDPARYAEIQREAAATINGDTLLFRIDRDGREPSWLFGTMHLTDDRVLALPDKARTGFAAADTLAIESTEILDPAQMQAALFAKPELTMFTDGKSLTDYLDDDQKAVLSEGLAKRGVQLALVNKMKPWLIASMIALPACEMDRKQAGISFLDLKLAEDARDEGKTLVGLEKISEQLEAMASLPMEFHIQSLMEAVRMGDRVDDVVETMIALYASEQTGMVWPMLHAVTEDYQTTESLEGYAAFEETMVHLRNRTMVERALPLLEEGDAFIAVGALHLPGEQGLAHLIQQSGYEVTPVYE